MKLKKFITALMCTAMAAVFVAGCGKSDASSQGETDVKAWDSSMDITIVSREDGSGTRGAFIELFGIEVKDEAGEKMDMTTEEAQITNSTSVMKTTVEGDEYAIGYISLGALDESVKAVKIDGVDATAENIRNGSYKVSRPFNIATKEDAKNPLVEDFVNFILSTDGQNVVSENGYIALEEVDAFESAMPEGKIVVGGSSSVSPVMEKLMEAYEKINENADIELQTTDSTTGMTSTLDGSYDIGMASRELKEEELSKGLVEQVIATDGIAVIVNKNNPIDDMTVEQVNAIYVGDALTWDEGMN